jgi:hypothetical protein
VCKAFKTASSPLFEETFFKIRQGTVGYQSLEPLLSLSHSRFNLYVKCLILNLFPTNWRPGSVPRDDTGIDKPKHSIAAYWDESTYYTWISDVLSKVSSENITYTLVRIFDNLPNLESICINAYSFNEYFCCSRRNYLALAAHKNSGSGRDASSYRISFLSLAADRIGYHQLLQTWNKSLKACYVAIQRAQDLQIRCLKLRVPQDMWRFGTPSFPRDVFRESSDTGESCRAWFKDIEKLTVSIIVTEPVIPQQLGSLSQTNDRWISRLMYGMESVKVLTIRSTDAELIAGGNQDQDHQKSLVLYRKPTLDVSSIEPDRERILPFHEHPSWTWPSLPCLSTIILYNIQVSYEGCTAFIAANKNTLKAIRFDGANHMYSNIESEGWFDFLLQIGIICHSLELQFTPIAVLTSFLWISDKWRVTETFSPGNHANEVRLEHWRDWTMAFEKAGMMRRIVSRNDALSQYDIHERLPKQFNPFELTPSWHFERYNGPTSSGPHNPSRLVIRSPEDDRVVKAGLRTESKTPLFGKLSAKLRDVLRSKESLTILM